MINLRINRIEGTIKQNRGASRRGAIEAVPERDQRLLTQKRLPSRFKGKEEEAPSQVDIEAQTRKSWSLRGIPPMTDEITSKRSLPVPESPPHINHLDRKRGVRLFPTTEQLLACHSAPRLTSLSLEKTVPAEDEEDSRMALAFLTVTGSNSL